MLKREVPVWLGLAAGLTLLIDYFFKVPAATQASREILQWRAVLAAFAMLLGVGNLTRIHGSAVARRAKHWKFSIVLLVGLFGYMALGLLTSTNNTTYKFIFDNLYQPLSGTWYSITVFYMLSAAWRAFRIRNAHSAIMLTTAVLVMLGQVGIGASLWSGLPPVASWLMGTGQNAGMRGIQISASLGTVAMSLRVLLGIERSHIGGVNG